MRTFLFVVAMFLAGHAWAITGDQLRDACGEAEKSTNKEEFSAPKAAACIFFIEGFAGGYTWGVLQGGKLTTGLACVPEKATYAERAAVLMRFARAHPELWHESASALYGKAMIETYPCK